METLDQTPRFIMAVAMANLLLRKIWNPVIITNFENRKTNSKPEKLILKIVPEIETLDQTPRFIMAVAVENLLLLKKWFLVTSAQCRKFLSSRLA